MTIYMGSTELDWGCGVKVVGSFARYGYSYNTFRPAHLYSGTGFFISSFINNSICKEAYEIIKKEFKIVYKSPVKVNTNSDNEFFFVVYRKRKN